MEYSKNCRKFARGIQSLYPNLIDQKNSGTRILSGNKRIQRKQESGLIVALSKIHLHHPTEGINSLSYPLSEKDNETIMESSREKATTLIRIQDHFSKEGYPAFLRLLEKTPDYKPNGNDDLYFLDFNDISIIYDLLLNKNKKPFPMERIQIGFFQD